MEMSLRDQRALVTGASRGIGRVIALTLGRAGADVAVAARSEDDLRKVGQQIEGLGSKALVLPLDLERRDSIGSCAKRFLAEWGAPDILVNNAATFAHGAVTRMNADDFERVLRVNLTGAMLMSQALVPAMAERGRGTVVMISSTSGLRSDPEGSAYSASKHGLQALSESLLKENRARGIRVVTVCPSSVDTRVVDDPASLPREGTGVRLRAEDVANAVLFACSLPGRALVKQIELWGTNP